MKRNYNTPEMKISVFESENIATEPSGVTGPKTAQEQIEEVVGTTRAASVQLRWVY